MGEHRGRTVGVGLYSGQRRGLRHAVPLAVAAEEAGFDAFWVTEHHGIDDGCLPSPLTLLAGVATATRRITLGTGLLIAPLHDPLRLAEDAAVVDLLSDGRLVLGLGLGYAAHEYRAFGVDPATRGRLLEALVPALRDAWTGRPFSAPALGLHDVRVTPAPGRRIPVWLGGYAPAAVRRAGRIADGHLVGRGTPEVVADAERHLGAVRFPCDPGFVRAVVVTVLLETPEGTTGSARRAFARQQRMYESLQAGRQVYSGLVSPAPDGDRLALGSVDSYVQVRGSAEEVAAGIDAVFASLAGWAEVHVVLRLLVGEDELGPQVERLLAVGRDVLPALAHRRTPGAAR
ncbi:LLM class flavin-dependent oxidoreductase [Pseudonocardia sp. ICBG1122]|nr:LLM class flavin-dependent oxidoreductase [Pseudonocardia pini]